MLKLIDQLNGGSRCRSRVVRARLQEPTLPNSDGPPANPPATPSAPSGAPSAAPPRASQCAPGAPAAPGPGRGDWQPPASALAPHPDDVPPSPALRPPPVSPLRPGGVLRGPRIRPHAPPRRRGDTRFEAPSVGAVPSPGRTMKVEFAPLNIPLARRLQTAAVLQWVLSFLLLAQVCIGIIVILIIHNYWFLYIPYMTWLYFDWRTPEQGGRRSNWVRSWTVWRYFKDYFPIHLIKTWDLDPSHNYIFGFHPHGVLVAGAFGNFCTSHSDFEQLFPGFTAYLHVLPFWFRCPLFREYLMSSGPVSVSKKSVSHVLSKEGGGNISVIVLGGAEESLDAHPGKFTLFIRQRKGFVKIALTHGASLVPVFSFGENELFKQVSNPEGSWLRTVQEKLQKIMGFALPLFHARGIFQYNFGLMPYRKPIHTVVGRPIPVQQTLHPTTEQIEELHQTYMEELRKLFEAHKRKYGIPEHKTLIFK